MSSGTLAYADDLSGDAGKKFLTYASQLLKIGTKLAKTTEQKTAIASTKRKLSLAKSNGAEIEVVRSFYIVAEHYSQYIDDYDFDYFDNLDIESETDEIVRKMEKKNKKKISTVQIDEGKSLVGIMQMIFAAASKAEKFECLGITKAMRLCSRYANEVSSRSMGSDDDSGMISTEGLPNLDESLQQEKTMHDEYASTL